MQPDKERGKAMEMEFVRRMPQPQELMRDYPLSAEAKKGKADRDRLCQADCRLYDD